VTVPNIAPSMLIAASCARAQLLRKRRPRMSESTDALRSSRPRRVRRVPRQMIDDETLIVDARCRVVRARARLIRRRSVHPAETVACTAVPSGNTTISVHGCQRGDDKTATHELVEQGRVVPSGCRAPARRPTREAPIRRYVRIARRASFRFLGEARAQQPALEWRRGRAPLVRTLAG
jgi:hypothetical protein